jgi:hypothetical protein
MDATCTPATVVDLAAYRARRTDRAATAEDVEARGRALFEEIQVQSRAEVLAWLDS